MITFAQDKELFKLPELVVEGPTYMFYGGGGELDWTYDSIVRNRQYTKTKNISCIITGQENIYKTPYCLYDERKALVRSVLDSTTPVDVYGWNDPSVNSKGSLPKKITGLADYRFSLAVENSREKNYISEKFYDPILTETIPIYFGATNIKEIYPENGYILINDITDKTAVLEILQYINDNADELYLSMLPELRKIKNRFFTEMNLLTKILELSNV